MIGEARRPTKNVGWVGGWVGGGALPRKWGVLGAAGVPPEHYRCKVYGPLFSMGSIAMSAFVTGKCENAKSEEGDRSFLCMVRRKMCVIGIV